jgi:hypothetical protein
MKISSKMMENMELTSKYSLSMSINTNMKWLIFKIEKESKKCSITKVKPQEKICRQIIEVMITKKRDIKKTNLKTKWKMKSMRMQYKKRFKILLEYAKNRRVSSKIQSSKQTSLLYIKILIINQITVN